MKYTGPGTDLTLGLPDGHIWVSGRSASRNGIPFTANLPTEEVFTIAHKDRVDGTVRASKPLSYGSTLIDGFSVTFEHGRIVKMTPTRMPTRCSGCSIPTKARGGSAKWRSCRTARRFRSRACSTTTRSSTRTPPATSRSATPTSSRSKGGNDMSDAEFEQAGGNRSGVHVDFMIGSGELDVDGVLCERSDGAADAQRRVGFLTEVVGVVGVVGVGRVWAESVESESRKSQEESKCPESGTRPKSGLRNDLE